MDDVGERRAFAGRAGFLQQQDDPLDADGEAAGRRGLAAQLLEQAVVASAPGDRALRPQPVGDPLEHGPIVIVEAAHEPRVDLERDAAVREEPLQAVEMGARLGAEPLDELRRAPDQFLHVRILGVEDAQRIRVQPALRVGVELLRACPRSRRSRSARCARRSSASPIELIVSRVPSASAERAPQPRQHHDLLGVDVGARESQRLDVELVELPVAAFLRALVAEHRAAGPHALRPLVGERMLDRGADDAGGRLGTQRQALAVELVLERVHLVFDDVGRIADAADEQRRRLDDRHAHVPVAVLREHGARGVLEALPERRVVGQHVVHAADRVERRRHLRPGAFTAIVFRSGVRCAARGSPP